MLGEGRFFLLELVVSETIVLLLVFLKVLLEGTVRKLQLTFLFCDININNI